MTNTAPPNETRQSLRSSAAELLAAVDHTISTAASHGIVHRTAEDVALSGTSVMLDGQRVINFGNCSYLGLELDDRVKLGTCDAVMRYGSQFSSSRTYLSAPPYREFEALLSRMLKTDAFVVAPTTSLLHLSSLPVIVEDHDAVVFDMEAHASMQGVLPELQHRGVPCYPVRSARLDKLEQRVRHLESKHRRILFLTDGVYSMHGNLLDLDELRNVLERHPSLYAYIDDAHAVGWAGPNGIGLALSGPRHERMIVVLGLAKGFASAGGVGVFPTREMARKVLTCGRSMVFSGPLQPPVLGAAIAVAKILLTDEAAVLQARVRDRIAWFDAECAARGIHVYAPGASPIRFVEVGPEEAGNALTAQLLRRGYFVNIAAFPAVARRRAGLRIVLTAQHSREEISGLVAAIAAAWQHEAH